MREEGGTQLGVINLSLGQRHQHERTINTSGGPMSRWVETTGRDGRDAAGWTLLISDQGSRTTNTIK